jgi:hypothetical protein
MNLDAPASLYLSVVCDGPDCGNKYLGFDSKDETTPYNGSSTLTRFLANKQFMSTITLATGTVQEILVLERKVLVALNARIREDFYNETNSNGFDLGIHLDSDLVSSEWVDEIVQQVLLTTPETINQKSDTFSLTEKLQQDEILLQNFLDFVNDEKNQRKELVPLVYAKISNNRSAQSRKNLLIDANIGIISARMRDEIAKGENPGLLADPVVVVTDKDGNENINSGHHTITCLHTVGANICKYVVYPGELLNFDEELIRRAGERLNKTQHFKGFITEKDCKFSLQNSMKYYLLSLGLDATNERLLALFERTTRAAGLKKYFRQMKQSDGYTSSQFDYAWKTLSKEFKMNKTLNGRVFISMRNVKSIIGETRDELQRRLKNTLNCSHTAKGEASMAAIGSAVAAAQRTFSEGADRTLIVLNQNSEVPILTAADRDNILKTFKRDITCFTRKLDPNFCPDIHIAILPAFIDDKLYTTHLRDITL